MAPFLVNSQKEMGEPDRIAIPRTTTLALAPIAVVSAEVRPDRKRPPQRISLRGIGDALGQLEHDRAHGCGVGDVVHYAAEQGRDEQDQHRGGEWVAAGGPRSRPRYLADYPSF